MRYLYILPLLLALAVPSQAGPNPDQLKSFKVIVADYSKTCGGISPAISPDGDHVAYFSRERGDTMPGDLYVSGPISMMDENTTVFPDKIEYSSAEVPQVYEPGSGARNIDWSPDGEWLAFIGRDGGVYICPAIKRFNKERTAPRRLVNADGDVRWSKLPRWSADGKRIAYVKTTMTGKNLVCVVDVASGAEKVLADDALLSEAVWQQPWSPDGRRLVYAGGKGEAKVGIGFASSPKSGNEDTSGDAFIAILSVDGSLRSVIKSNMSGAWPSWSPRGDRIAYSSATSGNHQLSRSRFINYYTMALWTCDSRGAGAKRITSGALLSKNEADNFNKTYSSAVSKTFFKQYGGRLNATQLKKYKSGAMTLDDMTEIAEALYTRETGIKFKLDKASSQPSTEQQAGFAKAMAFNYEALTEIVPSVMGKLARMDLVPVWSADGKRVAFMRGMPIEGSDDQLVVCDVATGKEQVLVDHGDVGSVSWSKSGKLVAAELRRIMSRSGDGVEIRSQPGYPEVWLLEPKG